MTGAGVILPNRALILRVGKLGLCLLDRKNFFFEVKLLVAGILLLLERIDLRVNRIEFVLPLVGKVGKLMTAST